MREPIVAGRFYSGTDRGCRAQLERIDVAAPAVEGVPEKLVAAVVPHAGWDYSGSIAMRVYRTVRQRLGPQTTFVIFGAVHSFGVGRASVYARGSWQTPLGPVEVDESLADLLLRECPGLLFDDASAHEAEHSIEVQLPMLRYVFGECRIVPVASPPQTKSHEVGLRAAEAVAKSGREVFFVGTTDLTHYGQFGYGFAPQGGGRRGLEWVKKVNDPRMIALMEGLKAEEVVAEAQSHHNACGGGAVAATLGAARRLSSSGGRLIEYTTSHDVLSERFHEDGVTDFVGYAGMVF